jgi:hypothetical protein
MGRSGVDLNDFTQNLSGELEDFDELGIDYRKF